MVDQNLLTNLRARGLVHQTTNDEELAKLLSAGPTVVYAGFDPTGDSLHIGHLIPLLGLRRFQLAGHSVIALAGGATGMVGDPSGRSTERNLLTREDLEHNKRAIKSQLSAFLDFEGENPAVLVDNLDWTGEVTLLDFLRDQGKFFRVNEMIKRDSVKDRLEREGEGLSFTEFSYMLLQGNDFRALSRSHGCKVQIGGSDQWGNIVAGTDLARKSDGAHLFGMTCPLLTRSDGSKFGKTAGGESVWLDPNQTSPFQFRQFWFNQADDDMPRLLRFFSFRSLEEIEALEAEAAADKGARLCQKALAREMTALVHGEEMAERIERAAPIVFNPKGDLREVDPDVLAQAFPALPLPRATLEAGLPWLDLVVQIVWEGANKRGQARKDIQNNGMSLNGVKWTDPEASVGTQELLHDRFLMIRKGKKQQFLVEVS